MRFYALLILLLAGLITGCTGVPKGIKPVGQFELEKYYGRWYEIARLDHRFERGLEDVTAEYSARVDGLVEVKNRGYKASEQKWQGATGKAKFKADTGTGHLLVSFFGPFYASYVIFELDDYQQAYVVGNSRKNLWFLSRTPDVTDADKDAFLNKVDELGFSAETLIWVEHSRAGQ